MVDVFVVIGDPNAHKTSTIRALTGVHQVTPKWDVWYVPEGSLATYVYPSGLQEGGVPPDRFISMVARQGVGRVIVALRYDPARTCPRAADYLIAFQEAGWNVKHAVLGPRPPLQGFASGIGVPNAPQMPSNEIAGHLRAAWGIA